VKPNEDGHIIIELTTDPQAEIIYATHGVVFHATLNVGFYATYSVGVSTQHKVAGNKH